MSDLIKQQQTLPGFFMTLRLPFFPGQRTAMGHVRWMIDSDSLVKFSEKIEFVLKVSSFNIFRYNKKSC